MAETVRTYIFIFRNPAKYIRNKQNCKEPTVSKYKENQPVQYYVRLVYYHYVRLVFEVKLDEFLKEFVPVKTAYEAPGIVIIRNICRVFRQDIPNDLINGVISFQSQRFIDRGQNLTSFKSV